MRNAVPIACALAEECGLEHVFEYRKAEWLVANDRLCLHSSRSKAHKFMQ